MADGRSPESGAATRNPVLLALVGLVCIAAGIALVRWQSFLFGPPGPPVRVTASHPATSLMPVPSPPSAAAAATLPGSATMQPPTQDARLPSAARLSSPLASAPTLPIQSSPIRSSPIQSGAAGSPGGYVLPLTGDAHATAATAPQPGATTAAGIAAAPLASTPPATRSAPPVHAAAEKEAQPSFDIVRVDPAGRTIIAGRAPGGSMVTVTAGQTVIGTTTADPEGQWVLAPDKPLSAGARTLALAANLPDGATIAGSSKVVVIVPSRKNATPAVALLDTPARPRLIEAPPPVGGAVSAVSLDLIQYGAHDSVSLAGRAPPKAEIRIYLDNHLLGDVHTDASGHWLLGLDRTVAPGLHQVRLDQIRPGGKVVARLQVPFDRTALPVPPGASDITVVEPGQCLWLIAQRVYGNGVRYTLIYQANRSQIRNPNLIYPGQVFTLPAPVSAARHG